MVWKNIAKILTTSPIFISKIKELRYKAADAGEYLVVTHDETFKTLFALIGQKKMAQAKGEFHALHTFRGFTGCTLGISPQRSTSGECFKNAVHDVFDTYLACYVSLEEPGLVLNLCSPLGKTQYIWRFGSSTVWVVRFVDPLYVYVSYIINFPLLI